jgi:hypothetical protein
MKTILISHVIYKELLNESIIDLDVLWCERLPRVSPFHDDYRYTYRVGLVYKDTVYFNF